MDATGQWTRVILLTPPHEQGGGMSESLRAQFEERDWFAIQQHEPHMAFTELCLRDKTQATRSSWGLQRMEQLALVITHPHFWSDLDQLAAAVRKYVSVATVWIADDDRVQQFESAGTTEADAVAGTFDEGDSEPEEASVFRELPMPAPVARSIPNGPSIPNGLSNHAEKSDPATTSQRITREEIDMLLQMDPEEQEHRA